MDEICSNQTELKKIYNKRKKEVLEQSISNDQIPIFEEKRWTVKRKGKTRTKLIKPKAHDEKFEDRIWRIFYNLQFESLNKDRKFKLEFGVFSKQIDVIAIDKDNIFIIECKSSESNDPIDAKDALEEFAGKREDIQKAIQKLGKRGRINIVVAISSSEKRPIDKDYVEGKKDKNIYLWSAQDIEYIEKLVEAVGSAAKYQLYSVIFAGKKQKSLRKPYPAIRGKIRGNRFYTFLIRAKDLLKYAYIHHRNLTGIIEASETYQRMLQKTKLNEIAKFIDYEDGYFPNSIIVNFSKQLGWDPKYTSDDNDDIAAGILHLPEFFGSAWIIDGQHRLYGAAKAKTDIMVPVLAFENMNQNEQANLFVDINEKQKAVPANLLWDLYSDIYLGSSDKKQKYLFQVSETAKHLNKIDPLKNCIDIPSVPSFGDIKLTFTTVCDAIKRCCLSCWDNLHHSTDEARIPENAARFISSYFEVLKTLWPEDWEKGNDGVILTNNGFGVFMIIFRDIMKHIIYASEDGKYKNKPTILLPHRTNDFKNTISKIYLTPVIEYLKYDERMQKDIRTKPGRGPQNDQAGILELKIQEYVSTFSPIGIDISDDITPPKEPPAISVIEQKAHHAEGYLRNFVMENLKRQYGDNLWWKQGLPGGVKSDVDRRWCADIDRKPGKKEDRTNETKFTFCDLGLLKDVIIYNENWETIFKDIFRSKEHLERRLKDIMALRNPSSHGREIDDQDVQDGIGGLLWLSRCSIEFHDLNPYT